MLFSSADKKVKKDKHKVGQKKQQKAKKGSDADSDVSSGEDGYLDSKEMDRPRQRVRLPKPSIPNKQYHKKHTFGFHWQTQNLRPPDTK